MAFQGLLAWSILDWDEKSQTVWTITPVRGSTLLHISTLTAVQQKPYPSPLCPPDMALNFCAVGEWMRRTAFRQLLLSVKHPVSSFSDFSCTLGPNLDLDPLWGNSQLTEKAQKWLNNPKSGTWYLYKTMNGAFQSLQREEILWISLALARVSSTPESICLKHARQFLL